MEKIQMIVVKQEKWGDLIKYEHGLSVMKGMVEEMIKDPSSQDKIWLLEHEDVYTMGALGSKEEILANKGIPVIRTDRGGKVTYHGGGQRIVYAIINLKRIYGNKASINDYVFNLEKIIIETLSNFGIDSFRINGMVGVWVDVNGLMHKIASVGIRLKSWITYHGFAINVCPDIEKFQAIIPCGIKNPKITSMKKLRMEEIDTSILDSLIIENFRKTFE